MEQIETEEERGFVTFLGQRLRHLRREQNLTQLDLARQVGITNGQISTIERGVSSPSIATLHRISQVLGVPMSTFFEDEDTSEVHVLRRSKGRRIAGTPDHVTAEVLCQRGREGGSNILLLDVDSGELRIDPLPRAGEDYFLYVLKGKCNLRLGDDSQILDNGDSACVKARREQWIRNVGAGPLQALLISQGTLIGSEVQALVESSIY